MFLRFIGAVTALSFLGLVGCGGGSSSDGSTTSTTYNISGTMGGLSVLGYTPNKMKVADYARYYVASAAKLFSSSGYGDNQASSATACSDGKYYRVLCSAWSNPPVAQYGDVSCSGSTGSFTVADLPLGSEVSCFIKVSEDGSSFSPFATLEVPAAAMGGTTDTMTPSGNVALTVTVSGGEVTTSISSGATVGGSTTTTVTPSDFNGYYGISCNASTSADNIRCKCMMEHDLSAYNGDQDACIADSASQISAPASGSPSWGYSELVDIRVYSGTIGGSGLDTDGDSTADLAAGSSIYGISVWGADCSSATSCSSLRSTTAMGDGLPTFGGVITWTSNTAITWPTGDITLSGTTGSDGTNPIVIKLSTHAIPADNATQAQWLSWLTGLVTDANWDCNMGGASKTGAIAAGDGFCVGNFVWQVLDQVRRDTLLPRLFYRHQCTNWSSCTITPNASYIEVEGIKFSSGNAVAGDSMGKQPGARYVLEQFIPMSSGGGGFKQSHSDMRWIPCLGGSGTDSTSGIYNCPGSANGIECGTREEMAIKFIPSGTTGVFTAGFARTNSVFKGVIRGGTYDGTGSNGSNFDAFSKCMAVYSASGGEFVAKFTKMAN